MKAFTVHAPPGEPRQPERLVFVKDGISWPALFVPLPWILWHRLWLTLLGWIIFAMAVAWIGRLAGDDAAVATAALGTLLFALEGNNIRRASLARRGWRDIGPSSGRDTEEAEMRFFESWTASEPPAGARSAALQRAAYPARRGAAEEESVFGLFPEPER